MGMGTGNEEKKTTKRVRDYGGVGRKERLPSWGGKKGAAIRVLTEEKGRDGRTKGRRLIKVVGREIREEQKFLHCCVTQG